MSAPHDLGTSGSLTIALALASGAVATIAARHLSIPGIVLLLVTGVVLGPELLGLVDPGSLGDALHAVVGFGVAVILFEGGMSLDLRRLRQESMVIRRMVLLGALITTAGGTAAAMLFLGWEPRLAILFGTLVIVTGPTVVTPLLRRIRVNRNVHTILEAEGVFGDAVGALIAVMALEVILADSGASVASGVASFPLRVGVGSACGLAGGLAIALLLRRDRLVPEGLENVLTLSVALLAFQGSNEIAPESGIVAAIVAGMVTANGAERVKRELLEFKEQLTVLFIGMIFVLLAADVRLANIAALGWPGAGAVAFLLVVVRPAVVLASTWGSALSWRERAFMSWLAPRGIVAAAVSALFAHHLAEAGIPGGDGLRSLVFLVIAITVVVQGLSGGLVASLLDVRRRSNDGYLIVGANPLARALARTLLAEGENAVLVDANPQACGAAEREGMRVVFGNALDERTLLRGEAESRRGVIALTPNEGVNALVGRRVHDDLAVATVLVAVSSVRTGVTPDAARKGGAELLFGGPRDLEAWSARFSRGVPEITGWRLADAPQPIESARFPEAILPLVGIRGRNASPVGDRRTFEKGDRLMIAMNPDRREEAEAWLRQNGWESASPG